MLRKNNYNNSINANKSLSSNISKIKYFLPSSNLPSSRGQIQQKLMLTGYVDINHKTAHEIHGTKNNKQNTSNPLSRLKQKLSKKYSSLSSHSNNNSGSKIQTKRSSSKKVNVVNYLKDKNCNEEENQINLEVGQDYQNYDNEELSFQIIGIRDVERNNGKDKKSLEKSINNKSNKKFSHYLCQKQQLQKQSNCYKLNLDQFHNLNNNKNIQYPNSQFSSPSYPFSSISIQNSVRQLSKSIQLSSELSHQSAQSNFPQLLKRMTQSSKQQKKQFQQFLIQLKNDQNYQNVISMFTVMYFYQKKKERNNCNMNNNKKNGNKNGR